MTEQEDTGVEYVFGPEKLLQIVFTALMVGTLIGFWLGWAVGIDGGVTF